MSTRKHTRPQMCPKIFSRRQTVGINGLFWCTCNYYMHNVVRSWHLVGEWKVLAINQKLIHDPKTPTDIQVLFHLPPFSHSLKVEFSDPQFWDVWGSEAAPIESESAPTISQYLSIQSFALSVAVWLEFQYHISAPPPIRPLPRLMD